MSYTYAWSNIEQTSLTRTDADGKTACVPTDPGNRDYAEFLAAGVPAKAYVAPPAQAPETTEQRVDHLLSDYGLTRSELLVALEAKPAVQQAKPQLDLTGASSLMNLDTDTLLALARQHNINVDVELLKPENHEAFASFMAASINLEKR